MHVYIYVAYCKLCLCRLHNNRVVYSTLKYYIDCRIIIIIFFFAHQHKACGRKY